MQTYLQSNGNKIKIVEKKKNSLNDKFQLFLYEIAVQKNYLLTRYKH